MPELVDTINYSNPGVKLAYPPEWHWMTHVAEDHTRGINLTIPFLNGTWREDISGPRFPPRGNYSQFFVEVRKEAF